MTIPSPFRVPECDLHADAGGVRSALRKARQFYVYVLCRPSGEPFYVGKGVGDRVLHHEAEARCTTRLTHKLNVIRSLHRKGEAVRYLISASHDDEADALAHERRLIAEIGRHDLRRGPLTNQTDGGEGTSNPSEESRQRRRDSLWGESEDAERQLANAWFQTLCSVQSVTIKPVSTWLKSAKPLHRNRPTFAKSERQAATLAASAIANRVLFEPGALLPRRLTIDGVEFIIENGVGRDLLSSGMVTLTDDTPTCELLCLTVAGFRYAMSIPQIAGILLDAGVLAPDPA